MPASVHLHAPDGHALPVRLLERAVRLALSEEGVGEGEISITFLSDAPILALNREWLAHDWVPDVLSFALYGAGEPVVGDVYVGVDQAARQAGELGLPVEEELVRLAIHGTLHVLGYDHPADAGTESGKHEDGGGEPASELVRKQEALLRETLRGESRGAGSAGPGTVRGRSGGTAE